ncbi:hypothetical protein ORI20_12135 [Mycobacterium sp. CVI_P3]|uniref:Uncharacterized protein n=1 Tax=Mycobacterium pinniadriaticum TaxID=2994102 RepID=A0ABT3SD84_9MYCO|nr:hypothetical protein [Mycobacterium pinniadriaticum]MCX2931030.1 hypothetical protein [Mycobacterium pinniadriaticum]MCX2937454.1 hypothetical protein [Mycobacterium pinniadriaticum]
MTIRTYIAAIVTAGLCALPIAAAPIASAAQIGPTCSTVSPQATLCQTNGSASLSAQPQARNYQLWYPWFIGQPGRHRR